MIRPLHTLLFLLGVMLVLALVGWAFPADGIAIGEAFTLRLPDPASVLFPKKEATVDISTIEAMTTEAPEESTAADSVVTDSSMAVAAVDTTQLAPIADRIQLHYPNGDKTVLHPLFAALEQAHAHGRPVRVMHYGDSQLEGDRITSYLRNKLQTRFGGSGPGLVSVADIVPNFSVDRELTGEWTRYSVMARKDPTQKHARFGALSSFSRFTPILPDSAKPDSTVHRASFTLRPSANAYAKAKTWSECRLFFGWHRAPVRISVTVDGVLVDSDVEWPEDRLLSRTWRFSTPPQSVTFDLEGADSPDIYGVSLEGRSGVCMDNIAARGGAGYEFAKVDQGLLRRMYQELDVSLLILQYGGNVLPNIHSKEEADQYGKAFGAQIARFRKMIPGVTVMVIGPSDMSIKEGDAMVTRPFLEDVRDALKVNTLAQGGVFWDMYTAMGGRNSMISWVEADPPLAATDYIHFSPYGARKVGELFHTAFIADYLEYVKHKE